MPDVPLAEQIACVKRAVAAWELQAGYFEGLAPEDQRELDAMRAVLARLEALGSASRWRHIKRGSTYKLLGLANVQASGGIQEDDPVVVYESEADGELWVRPTNEFYDGRFEEIKDAALPTPPAEPQEGGGR